MLLGAGLAGDIISPSWGQDRIWDGMPSLAEALEKGNQCPSGMSSEQTVWPVKVGGKSWEA